MTRMFGAALGGLAVMFLPLTAAAQAPAQAPAQPAATEAAAQPAPQKFTFNGEAALWSVAIRPDRTADFERIMQRLRDALLKSDSQERRQQAAGWRVVRLGQPLPDGNVAYVHVIHPVVPGADYSVMQTLYEAFPDERQELYDLYRNAFAQNLSLATGGVVLDMTRTTQAAAGVPAP